MASGGGRPPRDLRVLGRLPSGAPSPADLWPLSVAGPAQHPPTPQVSELTHCCCSVPGCLDSAWCSWPMCLHWVGCWRLSLWPWPQGPRPKGPGSALSSSALTHGTAAGSEGARQRGQAWEWAVLSAAPCPPHPHAPGTPSSPDPPWRLGARTTRVLRPGRVSPVPECTCASLCGWG